MEWLWNLLNSVGVVGALVLGIVTLARSPKVLWVVEEDEIVPGAGSGPEPYEWRLKLVNRGRAPATAVRTRYRFLDGTVSPWTEKGTIQQGDDFTASGGMTAHELMAMRDAFQRRGAGPGYEIEWRGSVDRRRPFRKFYGPSEVRTDVKV